MQHIVEIAFDFDDEKVRNITETALDKKVDDIITKMILDEYAPINYDRWAGTRKRDYSNLHEVFERICNDFLQEHKDEIIELAATKLSKSYKRTKAWKEKAGEVIK